jgi:hypothetical protein
MNMTHSERARKRIKRLLDSGLCVDCAKPSQGRRCCFCSEKVRERMRTRRRMWRDSGLCQACGRQSNGKSRCNKCREQEKRARDLRIHDA